ncbi:hypothetical protein T440DRAFT_24627 [Plenodomus tracheiphilus IPT5]|uniref:Zn(2)-C6 fungal-type domain-containing protein n=1 Tax=Plenodomus tracheiphilus IPT5 TaxID=1408161 RepID=A0A6A7BC07_9PLEO|nr:hypothetical protein T440DRAFT_24627 [Plenodomus tracheiphilus IPT5]
MPTPTQGKRRTVNESAEKPVKRTRVSRACDQCRTAREKCDGSQPTCSTCSGSKRRCTYTANPKKRGIQPGYIRSLELALVWLFQQNPANETSLNEKLSQGGASSLFFSRDSKEATKLHKRWRKARFYTDVDKLLSGGEPSRHERNDANSPSSDDEDSEPDQPPAVIVTQRPDTTNSNQTYRSARDPSVHLDLQRPYRTTGSDPIVMPSDSWSLFDTYFTYTQAWLPICEKHDILKLSYSYPDEGLTLATGSVISGPHAELWSVLAVASLYCEGAISPSCQSRQSRQSPKETTQPYDIARSLIPTEHGRFDLGHVKALLNLALFNIMLLHPQSAWLLVGYASRVLELMDSSKLMASPRRKHVFAGCFLLDSLLATQLNRRPHFRRSDLKHLGAIDEDGLEEWQPWYGHSSLVEQMRMPMLSLSAFNRLLDLVDIFASMERCSTADGCRSDVKDRIKSWELTLPSKLAYIHSEIAAVGLCPPAALLQFTYYCVLFASNPSMQGLEHVLHALERYKDLIGLKSLPPIIQCLLDIIDKKSVHHVVGESILAHLRRLQNELASTWSTHTNTEPIERVVHANLNWSSAVEDPQFSVSEPRALLVPIIQPSHPAASGAHHASTGYEALHTNARTELNPQLAVSSLAATDPRYPELNSDLENFFDELASLDSTDRMDTQPQFMQNLGFAPDASMADLFSEYIPRQSTAFVAREDEPGPDLDQYNFYNVG